MQFEKGHIFHIYNQGNNRQKIFFNRENYLFFLKKIRKYILPYSDILAWCLMPNHFHLMVLVNKVAVGVAQSDADGGELNGIAQSDAGGGELNGIAQSDTDGSGLKMRTFNDSIGIMLRSYTNAINKKYNRSGKLFREKTKAECLTDVNGVTPAFFNTSSGTQINIIDPVREYPEVCFHYIHENPVNAMLVKKATDWELSSAKDYAGLRNGKLVNKNIASEYINLTVGVAQSDADGGELNGIAQSDTDGEKTNHD